jgi:hypothetical protein
VGESAPQETGGRPLRPGEFCRGLLDALEASEGRRKRRRRDTAPDAIGLQMKRELLEAAAEADPEAEDFEAWLLERSLSAGPGSGMVRAMAQSIWDEWRLAQASPYFKRWLELGAPSEDRETGGGERSQGTVAG